MIIQLYTGYGFGTSGGTLMHISNSHHSFHNNTNSTTPTTSIDSLGNLSANGTLSTALSTNTLS